MKYTIQYSRSGPCYQSITVEASNKDAAIKKSRELLHKDAWNWTGDLFEDCEVETVTSTRGPAVKSKATAWMRLLTEDAIRWLCTACLKMGVASDITNGVKEITEPTQDKEAICLECGREKKNKPRNKPKKKTRQQP